MNENSTAKPPQSVSTPVSGSPVVVVVVVVSRPVEVLPPVLVPITPSVVPLLLPPLLLVPGSVVGSTAVLPVIASLAPPSVVPTEVVGVDAAVGEVVGSTVSPLEPVTGTVVTSVAEAEVALVLSPQPTSATAARRETRGEEQIIPAVYARPAAVNRVNPRTTGVKSSHSRRSSGGSALRGLVARGPAC